MVVLTHAAQVSWCSPKRYKALLSRLSGMSHRGRESTRTILGWRLCKVYGRMIGYPELKPHDLRHGVAMEVLEQHPHDLEEVRRAPGTSRIDTTQVYASIQAASAQARGGVLRGESDQDLDRLRTSTRSMFEEHSDVPKTRSGQVNEIELVAPYLKALRRSIGSRAPMPVPIESPILSVSLCRLQETRSQRGPYLRPRVSVTFRVVFTSRALR